MAATIEWDVFETDLMLIKGQHWSEKTVNVNLIVRRGTGRILFRTNMIAHKTQADIDQAKDQLMRTAVDIIDFQRERIKTSYKIKLWIAKQILDVQRWMKTQRQLKHVFWNMN